jgi:hypothetical protein
MKNLLIAGCLLAVPTAHAADPPKKELKAYTDPGKAGRDFTIQGEYVGENHGAKAGAQVIAEGDGKFTVRFLDGGLPGNGWSGKEFKAHATTENDKTTFVPDMSNNPGTGEIGDGRLTIGKDTRSMTFKRIVRHSPTEGAKPSAGAVVLFDSANADEWDHGKIVDGLLTVGVPGGQTSKKKFTDFTAHLEFILAFMPKSHGQARSNSGVYVQGRYEIQVLDSFALKGENNECGGIYQQYAPKVNMCYPPLQWQTYDIDFTAAKFADGKKTANARLTLKQNGVVILDDVELKKATPGNLSPESSAPGPIHLQNHAGDPVFYRNIWVVEKK